MDCLQGRLPGLFVPVLSQTWSQLRHRLTALLGSAGHARVLRALAALFHDEDAPDSDPDGALLVRSRAAA